MVSTPSMPPVGPDEIKKKKDFQRNLQTALALTQLDSHVFVDQFAKVAKLRKQVVTEYLAGMRRPYDDNLEKLAEFLRRAAPRLQSADFELPPEEFEPKLKAMLAAPRPDGVMLPMSVVAPSTQSIEQLRGTYRLFRFVPGKTPRLVSEALAIFDDRADRNTDSGTLRARLLPVEGSDAIVYEGAVVVLGAQINIILTHVGPHHTAMRTLMLQRDGNGMLGGIMNGALDDPDAFVSTTVALPRVSKDPQEVRNNSSLRKADATVEATREILLALGGKRAG